VTHPDNFLASAVWDDPYPYFARLRQDDPVSWNSWWKGWVITRYDDVDFLLRRSADVSAATVAPARARATPEPSAYSARSCRSTTRRTIPACAG
jgi:cytochrome P450